MSEDEVEPLFRPRRLVDDIGGQRLRAEPELRARQRHADDAWHVDLVRLAVCRAPGAASDEVGNQLGVAAVAVVEPEDAVAPRHSLRRRVLVGVRRKRLGLRACESELVEDAPDVGGESSTGHRRAVVFGEHRLQLVRVPDPHRGRELRRVPDEPRVAVVLGRAGLPRDGTVRQVGPPARP